MIASLTKVMMMVVPLQELNNIYLVDQDVLIQVISTTPFILFGHTDAMATKSIC